MFARALSCNTHVSLAGLIADPLSGIASVLDPKDKQQHAVVLKLSIVAGFCMMLKYVLVPVLGDTFTWPAEPAACMRNEWMAGDKLCTIEGNVHLAWEVPLLPASYYIPSSCTAS